MMSEITKCFHVYGIVQGVGFRPTVSRHAASCGVRGTVSNKGPYVEIIAQGPADDVARFRNLVEDQPPTRAFILNVEEVPLPEQRSYPDFAIVESAKTKGAIYISPDIAICETCKAELYDPKNRRYLHPFINCTCCGPRLTILDALPYDRERTSMKAFPMCPQCAAEYTDPASRRYDAQPVCCHDCGPDVYLIGRNLRGREAITFTRKVIRDGGIAAIKGIGGFHLCCDATNSAAVSLLRTRKKRPMKPFAVMARDPAAAQAACEISQEQLRILDGHQKPILLLKRRRPEMNPADADGEEVPREVSPEQGKGICAECAPENPKIGLMLPYTPLHLLLFDYDDGIDMPDYLVMTSANASGAPICRDDADAVNELGDLCDVMLSHERLIRIRADDTVMDFYRDAPYMVRRSRGYAPLPVSVHLPAAEDRQTREAAGHEAGAAAVPEDAAVSESVSGGGSVLAIGGELKNTFCIGTGGLFYLSPYVGDLEDIRTVGALKETVGRFETLLEAEPRVISCDMHPLYHSVETAKELAARREEEDPAHAVKLHQVQHHYAHVLSCMAENDFFEPVIGISYDGTGYGTDGTIWGGEILLSDLNGFYRAAHVKPFLQVGGDAGVREGWRIAAGLICQLYPDREASEIIGQLSLCSAQEAKVTAAMVKGGVNVVRSTSCGRLFDAVCAILGIRRCSTFEGEAATALQFAAQAYGDSGGGENPSVARSGDSSPNRGAGTGAGDLSDSGAGTGAGDLSDSGAGTDAGGLSDRGAGMDAGGPSDRGAGTDAGDCVILPTDALLRMLIEERLGGADADFLAWQFHRMLADLTTEAALRIRDMTGVNTAALTGGVFQNTLLLQMCEDGLEREGLRVLRHHLVPPNDGGIALGQAVSAAYAAQNAGTADGFSKSV